MATTSIDANSFSFLFFIWLVSSLLVHLILKKILKHKHKRVQNLPPSPPALPIIGHLHLLSKNLNQSFQTLATRYGPFLKISAGASDSLVICNAAIASEVLKTHEINFACRPQFGGAEYDIYKDSMFSLADYNAYWRFLKKVTVSELLSSQQINRYANIRKEERMQLLKVLGKYSEGRQQCDMRWELTRMTNNIICRMAMSTRCSENADQSSEIWALVKGVSEAAGKLGLGEMLGPLKKFDLFGVGRKSRETMIRYDNFVDRILVEHEKKAHAAGGDTERRDVMDILLEVQRDQSAEVKITRKDIKAYLLDIFLGGTDTSSVGLQWTLAYLINNPEVLKKLREEINTVVGSSRLVEESDVPNLFYLQAIVKESLRLNPPLPLIFRKCRKDCKIGGYDIPAESRMVVNVYAINRDPEFWENPSEFVPERFLESWTKMHKGLEHQLDIRAQTQNFNYLPFGNGRRGCPGVGHASVVLHETIASLIQCFDWKVEGDGKVDLEELAGFSLGMARPLMCHPVALVNPFRITKVTS